MSNQKMSKITSAATADVHSLLVFDDLVYQNGKLEVVKIIWRRCRNCGGDSGPAGPLWRLCVFHVNVLLFENFALPVSMWNSVITQTGDSTFKTCNYYKAPIHTKSYSLVHSLATHCAQVQENHDKLQNYKGSNCLQEGSVNVKIDLLNYAVSL